jgi:hypothetical protein
MAFLLVGVLGSCGGAPSAPEGDLESPPELDFQALSASHETPEGVVATLKVLDETGVESQSFELATLQTVRFAMTWSGLEPGATYTEKLRMWNPKHTLHRTWRERFTANENGDATFDVEYSFSGKKDRVIGKWMVALHLDRVLLPSAYQEFYTR